MAQKKPVTSEDLDLNRLPLPLVAALQEPEEETESFWKFMEARGEEAEQVREQARQAAMDLLRREDLID